VKTKKIKFCVECGQRWYRLSSWFPFRYRESRWKAPKFRRLPYGGWAFGPLMLSVTKKEG
jgi:hypothetical protein